MQTFTRLIAAAVPLDLPNIDTDQIIPARFLWRPRATGYGGLLFHDLRFSAEGAEETDFVLNAPQYAGAKILVAERNFGCGSSREQAVWALADYGFRVVIAPSFGDIFYNNCCQQGVLPITLPEVEVARLRAAIAAPEAGEVTVDLEQQTVTGPGDFAVSFDIAAFRRRQLLEGLDDVALTLALMEAIESFEAVYDRDLPWLSVVH